MARTSYEQYLAEQEKRKQAVRKLVDLNEQLSAQNQNQVLTPIKPKATEGSMYDVGAAFAWNLLDSVTMGGIQAFGPDSKYDFDKIGEMDTATKVATSLGQAAGFFVPFLGAAKVVSAPAKLLKASGKAISTTGKIKEVSKLANVTDKVNKSLGATQTSKIIEKSLRSKELKPFLQSYEISDDAILKGEQLFGDGLTANLMTSFKNAGVRLDAVNAQKMSKEILSGLKTGGLHKNNMADILFKKFGSNMEEGWKRNLMGYMSESAQQFATFTLYNAGAGLMQEMASQYKGEDYEYIKGLADSLPSAALFSMAAPLVDFIPGGKGKNISGDAARLMKILFKKPGASMDKKTAEGLVRLYGRYDSPTVKKIIQSSKYKKPDGSKYTLRNIERSGIEDGVAQKMALELWTNGRNNLIRRFGTESRKDLIGSIPRMTVDAALFAGVDYMTQGSIISRAGVEDTWVNLMVGAFMAKKRRPIAGFNQNIRDRYTDSMDGYKGTYEEQVYLLEAAGLEFDPQLKHMLQSYDSSAFAVNKGKAFMQNDNVKSIVGIFDEAYSKVEDRDGSTEDLNLDKLNTLRNSYKRLYLMAKLSGVKDVGELKEINFSKFTQEELNALDAQLNKFQFEDVNGDTISLKGNTGEMVRKVLNESSSNLISRYTDAAKLMAEELGSTFYEESDGALVFKQANTDNITELDGITEYNNTLNFLEDNGANIKIGTPENIEGDIELKSKNVTDIVNEEKQALVDEFWGYEKDIEWADNDLTREVDNAKILNELSDLTRINKSEKFDDRTLSKISDYMAQLSQSSRQLFNNFNDGFTIKYKDGDGKDIDESLTGSDIEEINMVYNILYRAFVTGKMKSVDKLQENQKTEIDLNTAKETVQEFKSKFRSLYNRLDSGTKLLDDIERHVFENRFEDAEVSDSSFALATLIMDDYNIDVRNFPSPKAAKDIIKEEAKKNNTPDEVLAETMKNVDMVYDQIKEMSSVFQINKNFAPPKGTDESGNLIVPENYTDIFNGLAKVTDSYYRKEVLDNIREHKSRIEDLSDKYNKQLNDLMLEAKKMAAGDITEDGLKRAYEQSQSIVSEFLKDDLINDNLRKELEDLNENFGELLKDLAENRGNIEIQKTIFSEIESTKKSVSNQMEKLRNLVNKDADNKKMLSTALKRLVYSGSFASNRKVVLEAYDQLRSRLIKELGLEDQDAKEKIGINELLEKYNKTGDFKDFKQFLNQLQIQAQRVWDPEEYRKNEELFEREATQTLDEIKDAWHNLNPDSIIRNYLGNKNQFLDENGRLKEEISSGISNGLLLIRGMNEGQRKEGIKILNDQLKGIIDPIIEKIGNNKADKAKFLDEEIGPLINNLINSYTTNSLKYIDGRLSYKKSTHMYTPLDSFIDNMHKELGMDNILIELDNSAIIEKRIKDLNSEEFGFDDMIANGLAVSVDDIAKDYSDRVANREKAEEIAEVTARWGNSSLVRIGVSNYKNLIFNISDPKSTAALKKSFSKWHERKLKQLGGGDKPKDFLAIFEKIMNTEPDKFTRGQVQVMVRTMYYDTINSSMLNTLFDPVRKDGNKKSTEDAFKDRLKFLKYVHVIEGAMTSSINNEAVRLLAEYQYNHGSKEMALDMGAITQRDKNMQLGTVVIKDESESQQFLNNQKFVERALDVAKKSHAGNKHMTDKIDKMIEDVQDNKWKSIGKFNDDIVSVVNGITFVSKRLANTLSGVRGVNIQNASEGIKPVVRHNNFDWDKMGSEKPSTLVMKTMMVYDPEIAKAMDEFTADKKGDGWSDKDNLEIITFDSAAKSFSGKSIESDKRVGSGKKRKSYFENARKSDGMKSLLEEGLEDDYPFYISLEDIGVNYMTKPIHRSPITPSLLSSMDESSLRDFLQWMGYDKNGLLGKQKNYFDSKGRMLNGTVKALIQDIEQQGLSMEDPSISTFTKLINAGMDAESPMVYYDVLKILKSNFVDTVSRPLSKYANTSPLVPPVFNFDRTLDMPIFDGDKQISFGGIKVAHDSINKPIGNLNNLSLIYRGDNGEDVIANNKTEKNGTIIKSLFKLIGNKGQDITIKNVVDLFDVIKSTKKLKDVNEIGEFKVSKKLAEKIKSSNIEVAVSALRIPKQSGSDYVVNRIQGYFEPEEGNFVASNAFELATKHQGDYDVDKLFYYTDTPISILNTIHKRSAEVIDVDGFDSNYLKNNTVKADFDIFQQDLGLINERGHVIPAGESTTDGVSTHVQNTSKAAALLGRSVKLLSSIPTLKNIGFKLGADSIQMGKEINQNIASLISAAVDHHGGIARFILDKSPEQILRWALFKDSRDVETQGFPVKGDNDANVIAKKGYEDVVIEDGRELNKTKKDLVIEAIMEVGKMSRVFSGVYDEAGGRAPEMYELRDMYTQAETFFKNPAKVLFDSLMRKYIREGRVNGKFQLTDDISSLINLFFPGHKRNDQRIFKDLVKSIKYGEISDYDLYAKVEEDYTSDTSDKKAPVISLDRETTPDQKFDMSPAGKVLKTFGQSSSYDPEGIDGFIPALGTNLAKFRNMVASRGVFGNLENLENDFKTIFTDPEGNIKELEGLRIDLSDLQKRSALYSALEHDLNKVSRQLEFEKSNKFSDPEKVAMIENKYDAINSAKNYIERYFSDTPELLGNIDNSKIIQKGQSFWTNNSGKTVYVYKNTGVNKNNPKFTELEPVGRLESGDLMNLSKYYDHVVLQNPLVTKDLSDKYSIDGLAWFYSIPGHSEMIKGDDNSISDINTAVEKIRDRYKKRMNRANRNRIENKSQNVYEMVKVENVNDLAGLFDTFMGDISPNSGSPYVEKLQLIVHSLLRPKAVFGAKVIDGQGNQLPFFVQDHKFAKQVLDFMFKGNEEMVHLANEIVTQQGAHVRNIKDGRKFNPQELNRLQHLESQKAIYQDAFNYDDATMQILDKDNFFKELVFSNYGTPASAIMNIKDTYPGLKGKRRNIRRKNSVNEVYFEAEYIRHRKQSDKNESSNSLMNEMCVNNI